MVEIVPVPAMDVMDYLKENLRPLCSLLGYAIAGIVASVSSHWTWMGLVFITILCFWGWRGVQRFQFVFSRRGKLHEQRSVILQSFSSSCASNHGAARKNGAAFANHTLRIGSNMCMNDPHLLTYKRDQNLSEKSIFKTKGSYSIDSLTSCNSVEAGGARRKLGPCWLDNCVDLGLWRRPVSFEIQSLRLGYDWNWNCYTGRSGLNLNKFSKYSVRDIEFAKVLGSPKGSQLVKLHSFQENAVSSVDMVWNMQGLSCTSTIDNTVRLWDIEVGKCLDKMGVDDYTIVGSHIENSPGFLLSSSMIREHEKASLFVWDPRDFLKPLSFSAGNMLPFPVVHVKDKTVCVCDCFSERQFDLRMISGSSPIEVCLEN